MSTKRKFLWLGWVTLVGFSAVGVVLLYFIEDVPPLKVLQLDKVFTVATLYGAALGLLYGFFVNGISQTNLFKELMEGQRITIKNLQLSWLQMLFISFCAGFGEEVLFRAALQTWLGPWWATLIFIAVHGYFNPKSWKTMLPGILLFPFILWMAFGYQLYGLWFCVAAHTVYDLLMFYEARKS